MKNIHKSLRRGGGMVATVMLLLLASAATAQFPLTTQSSGSASNLVDENKVLENVTSSFDDQAASLVANARLSDKQRAELDAIVKQLRSELASESELLVSKLQGDGVLQADEVTAKFANLRDAKTDKLQQAVSAITQGYPPPPQRDDYSSTIDYLSSLWTYSFSVRNDTTDWLLLIAALTGGLLLSWVTGLALRSVAGRLRKRSWKHAGELVEAVVAPAYLAIVALSLKAGAHWLWISELADGALAHIVNAALLGALFWFLWNACQTMASGLTWILKKTYKVDVDNHVNLIVSRALRIVVLGAFGLVLVNGVMQSNLTGFIAGLGVLGIIVSFLLRGTIENIAASFTIFGDKPFRTGDLVVFADELGTVEDIGFRSTRLRTLEGHLITIPNSNLVDDAIQNISARPSIRRRFRIGLTYDTPPEKVELAMEIIKQLLDGHEGQPADQKPRVVFEGFGDYDLKILIQYHFEPADFWEALEFDSKLNLQILRRFDEERIPFAFPTQSVYLHADKDAFAVSLAEKTNSEKTESEADPGNGARLQTGSHRGSAKLNDGRQTADRPQANGESQ